MQRAVQKQMLLAAAILAAATPAWASQPFTIDQMLRQEEISRAAFDPSGRYLVFEYEKPFEEQAAFGFSYHHLRNQIWLADLSTDAPARPAFAQRADESHVFAGISPDGDRFLYLRHVATPPARGPWIGTYDFATGRQRDFQGPISASRAEARWATDESFLYLVAQREAPAAAYSTFAASYSDHMSAEWRAAREGRRPTASQVTSGRYRSMQEPRIVVGDAATGESREIGAGKLIGWERSPTGALIAAVRARPADPSADARAEQSAQSDNVKELIIFDAAAGWTARSPRGECDVLHYSLDWSADGRFLSFFARHPSRSWDEGEFWVFDSQTRQIRAVDHRGLTLSVRQGRDIVPSSAWVGSQLAFLAARSSEKASWFVVPRRGEPVDLLRSLESKDATAIGTGRSSLIVRDGNKLWSVSAGARARPLTADISGLSSVWDGRREGTGYTRFYVGLPALDTVVLQIRETSKAGQPMTRLVFADPERGPAANSSGPLLPSKDLRILAVAPQGRRVAYLSTEAGVDVLRVDGAGSSRILKSFNRHLADVTFGNAEKVSHVGTRGEKLTSWLVLPPGYDKSEGPLPTVVLQYPALVFGDSWEQSRRVGPPFGYPLLASHGYAVLYASMPRVAEVPRDPLQGMADQVLSALDAAIATGYVDPGRVGLYGHSYGGYSALGIIGQTRRFKAVVANASTSDLFTNYGAFDIRERVVAEFDGLDYVYGPGWSESGQGGMGGPPWRDPERYLRNSPLMNVEAIQTPVLLLHGDLDFVPITQAEEMFTALHRMNKDAVFVRYWGEGHWPDSPPNIRDWWRRVLAWYDEHIGPPYRR